jgi:hypothetical protein
MKITYPVPQRTIVGYRQVPVYRTDFVPETLFDYDFKVAHRAKHGASALALTALAYVAVPVMVVGGSILAIGFRFARGFINEVKASGSALKVLAGDVKGLYRAIHADIADYFREVHSPSA